VAIYTLLSPTLWLSLYVICLTPGCNRICRFESKVEVKSHLADVEINLSDINNLKVGDVIPFYMPEKVVLEAEEIPLFRGTLGVSRGNAAIKIIERVTRPGLNFET